MRMRISVAFVVMIFLNVCASSDLLAQADSIATATAKAKVVKPVSATQTQNLMFGEMKTTSAGTATINAQTDARGTTGGVNTHAAPAPHAAIFSVTGEPNLTYSVSLPNSITVGVGTATDLTKYSAASFQLNNSGNGSFRVGGKLSLPAGVNAFTTFQTNVAITINYN